MVKVNKGRTDVIGGFRGQMKETIQSARSRRASAERTRPGARSPARGRRLPGRAGRGARGPGRGCQGNGTRQRRWRGQLLPTAQRGCRAPPGAAGPQGQAAYSRTGWRPGERAGMRRPRRAAGALCAGPREGMKRGPKLAGRAEGVQPGEAGGWWGVTQLSLRGCGRGRAVGLGTASLRARGAPCPLSQAPAAVLARSCHFLLTCHAPGTMPGALYAYLLSFDKLTRNALLTHVLQMRKQTHSRSDFYGVEKTRFGASAGCLHSR